MLLKAVLKQQTALLLQRLGKGLVVLWLVLQLLLARLTVLGQPSKGILHVWLFVGVFLKPVVKV